MLVETEIEILDRKSAGLFSNQPFEKRPEMTIEEPDTARSREDETRNGHRNANQNP